MPKMNKILGLIVIIAGTAASTIMTQWMTNREIENKVSEAFSGMEKNNKD